jgi:hypothetical protein
MAMVHFVEKFMLTSLRIDDDLYRVAKAGAASEGLTITKYLDQALRLRLAYDASDRAQKKGNLTEPISLPTCPEIFKGHDFSMAELNAAVALQDGEEAERFLRLSKSVADRPPHA